MGVSVTRRGERETTTATSSTTTLVGGDGSAPLRANGWLLRDVAWKAFPAALCAVPSLVTSGLSLSCGFSCVCFSRRLLVRPACAALVSFGSVFLPCPVVGK